MVELLIKSDIAKYCEFKSVTRVLTLLDDKLQKVHYTCLHITHVYTLHMSTHYTCLHITHVYTLHMSTHYTCLHITHVCHSLVVSHTDNTDLL